MDKTALFREGLWPWEEAGHAVNSAYTDLRQSSSSIETWLRKSNHRIISMNYLAPTKRTVELLLWILLKIDTPKEIIFK